MDEKMIFNDMKVLNEAICSAAFKSEAAIFMLEQLEKEVKKEAKKAKFKASINTLFIMALGYGLYSLSKKMDKAEAKQIAMQTEIDMFGLERGIEETK